MYLKKDDEVIVISGREKGKKGKIIQAYPKDNKVVIEGVNIVKKHKKPRSANDPGGIIEMPAPLDASKVLIYDSKAGKGSRIKYDVDKKGNKVRVTVKSGSVID